jgi:hypothetical protein
MAVNRWRLRNGVFHWAEVNEMLDVIPFPVAAGSREGKKVTIDSVERCEKLFKFDLMN